jgi:acyl-CoA hydrolase/RimJ/RimL family protein N-acetyltransferase
MLWKTADEALALLRSGMRVFVASGCAAPQQLLAALARRGTEVYDVEIVHILTFGDAPYASRSLLDHFRHNALFIGPNVRDAVNEAVADYTPIFLSDIPGMLRRRALHLDYALIQVTPPDAHGYCSLGVSVDVVKAAVASAARVVAQVNPQMPRTLGDSFVHVSEIDAFVQGDQPLLEHPSAPPSPGALLIAQFIASLIPDGATLQTGIGEIPSAVLAALGSKRDLGMHTEMLTEAVRPLIESGVLNGKRKTLIPGKIVTSFCFGNRDFYAYIHDNPAFEFRPTEFTNDPFQIARNHCMVAVSSAIEVDLTGQVCADSIGDRFYSGFGGQVDFIRGAARSEGGKPIIALLSTAKGGSITRIVARLQPGAGVVTTRADVHYVVTEHGIASLHGKTVRERALALIHIADPSFREELLEAARQRRLVHPAQIALPPGIRPYPMKYERYLTLEDGLEVLLRPIQPSDEGSLRELFYSHSEETVLHRYFARVKRLTHEQVQKLVTLDYRDEMALAGFVTEQDRTRMICVGRYHRDPATNEAEVAFTVHDAFQGRGLGRRLAEALAVVARENGIGAFVALVLPDNPRMLRVLQRLPGTCETRLSDGVYRVRICLATGGDRPPTAGPASFPAPSS